jgi:hypothetical protein
MMHEMCSEHDEPGKCETELDKLDGKGIFKAMLKADVFTDDFRRNVLKGSLDTSEMPEKEKQKILAHIETQENNNPTQGPIRPLSIRRAVKDSIKLIRGKVPDGL